MDNGHKLIFRVGDKFYSTYYDAGSTEMQSEIPWKFEETVECKEVKQVEKLVKVWVEVEE